MREEHKKFILQNIRKKSIKEIAANLKVKERKIKKFLEKEKKKQRKTSLDLGFSFKDRTIIVSIVLIVALGFLVYANSLSGEFLWDDEDLVNNNVYIRSFSNLGLVFSQGVGAGVGKKGNFYRPLQIFTYMLDYSLWKLNPKGFHLTNNILHILTALALYLLIYFLFRDKVISLIASLLFVVHPIHTEAVTYISGRADCLSALFMFLCFIFYIRYLALKRLSLFILTLSCFILALLSREGSFILPFLLLVYHYTFKKKPDFKMLLSIFGLALVYIASRLTLLKDLLPSASACPYSLFTRLPGVFVALTNYLRLLFLPFGLHMEYGYKLFNWSDFQAITGVIILIALLFLYLGKRKDELVFFSMSWFFITFLPVSGLYPINAYMAEHWLYLPSIGFFLIVANIFTRFLRLKRFKRFQRTTIAFFIGLIAFYSFLTIRQNSFWKEPVTFYKMMLKYAPDSPKIYNNLGIIYYNQGKEEEAVNSFKKAIEVDETYAPAVYNLGKAYYHSGKNEEAIPLFKKAIQMRPEYVYPYNNLGASYQALGRIEEAIEVYKKAIEINPGYAKSYGNLGGAYYAQGRIQEAIDLFKKEVKLNPYYADGYCNLGISYNALGENDQAIRFFNKALEVDPKHAESYNNLAIVYLYKKEYKLAEEYYRKAKSLGFANSALEEALKSYPK